MDLQEREEEEPFAILLREVQQSSNTAIDRFEVMNDAWDEDNATFGKCERPQSVNNTSEVTKNYRESHNEEVNPFVGHFESEQGAVKSEEVFEVLTLIIDAVDQMTTSNGMIAPQQSLQREDNQHVASTCELVYNPFEIIFNGEGYHSTSLRHKNISKDTVFSIEEYSNVK